VAVEEGIDPFANLKTKRSRTMKIAITSKGTNLESEVEPRFGRAPYFIIVDTETMEFEAVDNASNVNAFKGAGIQAAAVVGEKGAEAVLTGFCGPNAFKGLNAAGIKVANDVKGRVRDVVHDFKNNKYTFADSANVEGNW
jgi:predicted Fe-Mo cluster-binding NifX family protein